MRSLFVFMLCGLTAHAQIPSKAAIQKAPPADPKDVKVSTRPVPKDGKLIIPITLHPTAVKRPLSRYFLTPQYPEMKPGNRVPTFMRAFMEQDAFFAREQTEKRHRWNELSLEDLPLAEIKSCGAIAGLAYRPSTESTYPSRGRPLADVDEGARQFMADWQIWFNIREDGIFTLLPEVQRIRELGNVLQLRMRYEIRTGDIEKAIYSARSFHGLATAFESHPTLIGFLVGLAIENQNLDALEELIQQPNCPNLYWSFTEFPASIFNNRLSTGGEKILANTLFAPILEAQEPLSEVELYKQMKIFDSLAGLADNEKPLLKYSLDTPIRSTDRKKVASAKSLLIESGTPAKLVEKFSDLQIIIMADIRQYETLLDDMLIANSLPYADAVKLIESVEKRMKDEKARLAQVLLPSNRKITSSHARTRQKLAYLRVIEAIRFHAYEHQGQLPATLAQIKLPLPLDPVTDQPFEYALKDGVATLHGGNPSPGRPEHNRYYEIRIKK